MENNAVIKFTDANTLAKLEAKIKKLQGTIKGLESKQGAGTFDPDDSDKLEKYNRQLTNAEVKLSKLNSQKKIQTAIQRDEEKAKATTVLTKDTEQYGTALQSIQDRFMAFGLDEKQAAQGQRHMLKSMEGLGYEINQKGDWYKASTGNIISMNKAISVSSRSVLPAFQGWMLSTMFIAQGLSATFGGMIKQTLGMTGIFDAFSGVLAGVLLPVLIPIAMFLLDIFSWLSQSEVGRSFIAFLIISLAILGQIVGMATQLGMLFFSLGKVKALLFLKVLGFIAAAMLIIWGLVTMIQGFMANDWKKIMYGIMAIAIGIAAVFLLIGGLIGGWIPALIAGVVALVAWLIGAIKPLREFFESIGNWFGGKGFKSNTEIGLTPMANGGIVTGPTPALVGEAGPEAIIPLSKLGDSGIGGTINYNPTINLSVGGTSFDARNLATQINSALHDDLRSRF
jgi:hypothetical protein